MDVRSYFGPISSLGSDGKLGVGWAPFYWSRSGLINTAQLGRRVYDRRPRPVKPNRLQQGNHILKCNLYVNSPTKEISYSVRFLKVMTQMSLRLTINNGNWGQGQPPLAGSSDSEGVYKSDTTGPPHVLSVSLFPFSSFCGPHLRNCRPLRLKCVLTNGHRLQSLWFPYATFCNPTRSQSELKRLYITKEA